MARPWHSLWFIVGALALVGALILMRAQPADAPGPAGSGQAEARLAGHSFRLDIADTPELQRRGLAGRESVPRDGGMYFRYDSSAVRAFWMKDMRAPIDIVWLSGLTVTGVVTRALPPPPGTADAAIPRFTSPGPVDGVIELAAGRAGEIGLAVGQRVEILVP